MLNQVILVGRLTDDLKVIQSENGKSYSQMTLAVQRNYKNTEGVYETDFINVAAFESIAKNTSEYCKKGDIIGVKGRLQTSSFEDKDNNKKVKLEIIAEKITFLSSNRDNKNKEDQER